MSAASQNHVLALSAGAGGAKLAHGLLQALPADSLSIALNTGDDFEHLGPHISPDIDTARHTLAGLANPLTGWGRRDETWTFMQTLAQLGGETWFQLGDGKLAMYVERTRRHAGGESLTRIVTDFTQRLGIRGRQRLAGATLRFAGSLSATRGVKRP
jgi:LPPG:FO 2-phospho-L-lactate transferase